MTLRTAYLVGVVAMWAGAGQDARAQFIPPSVPAPATLPSAVPAVPAAPKTLWSFLGLSKANHAACKEKLCTLQAGQMLNNGLKPFSLFTGGIVPPGCCPALPPPPPGSDLAGPAGPDGAQSAAAAVAADQAGAAARIAAIEYLSTVDCHYWPEATAALIGRLRSDRVECVRFAAALALRSGCCCTTKTVEALANVLSDRPDDNFPSENSERVKAMAFEALQRCMACMIDEDKPPQAPPEPPGPPATLDLEAIETAGTARTGQRSPSEIYEAYYNGKLRSKPPERILADARRALGRIADARDGRPPRATGSMSVAQSFARAMPPARPPRASGSGRPHGTVSAPEVLATLSDDPPSAAGREAEIRPIGRPSPAPEAGTRSIDPDRPAVGREAPSIATAPPLPPSGSQGLFGLMRRSRRGGAGGSD